MITIVKLDHTMLYRVPYDNDCQIWPHNVVQSTIWLWLSNLTTQCCTEYHMITIVKLDHTMLYRVPYDHDCQTWPHNVVPSTIWSRLSNFTTKCCTEYHMITIVKLDHTMLYRVPYDHDCQTLSPYVVPSTTWWRSRRPLNLYYNHVITTAKMWYLLVKLCIFKQFQIKYIYTCIKKHW
jgi:hypothetical protein